MAVVDQLTEMMSSDGQQSTSKSVFKYVVVAGIILLSLLGFSLLVVVTTRTIDRTQPSRPTPQPKCKSPPSTVNHFDTLLQQRDALRTWDTNYVLLNGRTMNNSQYTPISLIIENGKIVSLKYATSIEYQARDSLIVVDLKQKFVTPGLVDIHSHLGVYSFPEYEARNDGNEMTNPALPQVRAIDALNPKDLSIRTMLNYGITSAIVLPGSGNVMGGEAVFVKLVPDTSVQDMLMSGAPRALKMACGENPKNVYGFQGLTPMSRMGNAWVMREKFEAARKLLNEQDEWDCNSEPNESIKKRPSDLSLEPLVALLRGQDMYLNVHCYEVQDMEMVVRLSQEFGFTISAFHHALEAHLIPKLLRENNITACIFSDLFGYKVEAYEASVHAPRILNENNVKVAIKTDHPAVDGKLLMFNAAKSRYYGFDEQAAFDSITRVPAETMKIGHRVGSLAVNYDADIVVWDRNPLNIGAAPAMIFVDGYLKLERNLATHDTRNPLRAIPSLKVTGTCSTSDPVENYAVRNVKIYTLDSAETVISNGNIIVQNGNISCVGTVQQCPIVDQSFVVELQGGVVVPGFVESGSYLGLMDIEQEELTNDGSIIKEQATDVLVRDGIIMESKPMTAAWKSGVTTSISHLTGSNVVNGQSAAFTTIGTVIEDTLIKSPVALQLSLGHKSKEASGDLGTSVSGQVAIIRKLLQEAATKVQNDFSSDDIWSQVIQRKVPVVSYIHKADWISQMLSLREKFGFKLIIVGAAEAHILSHKIAKPENKDSVFLVLTPMAEGNAPKQDWDKFRTDDVYGINNLVAKGVPLSNIILANGYNPYGVRNLRFLAGWIHEQSEISTFSDKHISWQDALAMITRNPANAFNLGSGYGRIQQGTAANFVLLNSNGHDDNVLTFDNQVKAIFAKSTVDCSPVQL